MPRVKAVADTYYVNNLLLAGVEFDINSSSTPANGGFCRLFDH